MTDSTWQESLFERAPGVLWRRSLDGVLVLAPGENAPLHISPPGDGIWELLAQSTTADQLTDCLANLYDVGDDVVQADVRRVLATLWDVGAIRAGDPDAKAEDLPS